MLLPALAVVFGAAGCFDESTMNPDGAGMTDDTEMSSTPVTIAFEDPKAGTHEDVRTYEITLENLSPATGDGASQPFSPPVLATHRGDVHMFRVGRFASDELAQIAQDAVNGPMVKRLEHLDGVQEVETGDAPIGPGESGTYEIRSHGPARKLSMAFMLVNTNDGFTGLDAMQLPEWGSVTLTLHAYDAGSEANDELAGHIPGPCCGHPFAGDATHERIRPHAGILGIGDLSPALYGWDEPVARVTIRRLAPAYAIEVKNLTPATGDGSSQVFSPPILATHTTRARMFRVGGFASPELALIAEDGNTGPMQKLLSGSAQVWEVVAGDAPIPPGGTASYGIETAAGYDRLSAAFMLVNTNDGFSGVDRIRLPRGGQIAYRLNTWDAGSEENTELAAHIPGPCCGSHNVGPDTHERIRAHRGILGIGDLDPAVYGWEDPSAMLTVPRIR